MTMASHFEIVDEEYIEELKDESENENKKNSTSGERMFSKSGQMKETCKQIYRRVRERCPRPMIVTVLRIQKFSNFALYVINK